MADLLVHGPPAIRVTTAGDGRSKAQTPCAPSRGKRQEPQKRVAFHPLAKIIRDTGNFVLSWRDGLTESEREDKARVEERMQILAARMQNATSLMEWESAAKELDRLEGNDEWKLDPSTGDYHPELIEAKLRELDTARTNCDIRTMMYLIRTALSRDLGGMGNIDLYRHSYIGTKDLIERYVDSAIKTIESVVEKSAYALPMGLEPKDMLEEVLCARQSFGRSALLLSGGATFGMSHIGVLKALYESNLLPRIISGASAGSIVCSVLCTRKDEEVPDLIARFPYGDLGVFEGENEGLSDHIRRLLTEGSWADISNLTRVMRAWLGDLTFQEAYNRTRKICNICVSSASIYELPRLLNYVTAPNVMIWSAVAASCSVPLIFKAAPLLVKDPATGAHVPWNPTPQRWIDGSVDNDLPMTRLAEMFNVNHFIVSQVNPHVVPFLSKDDRLYPATAPGRLRQQQKTQDEGEWLYTLTSLAKDETLHRLQFLTEMGIFPNLFTKLRCILSQRYSGDITILPEIAPQDLPLILKNPTSEFMQRNCLIGERATWPKLSRVRDRCAIELALDHAVHALRARVVFSKSSQINLRRLGSVSEIQALRKGLDRGASVESGVNIPYRSGRRPHQSCHSHHSSGYGTPAEERAPRRRRSSGSSLQLLATRPKRTSEYGDDILTDDQSEEDERLEISSWRHSGAQMPISRPKLKRTARSQTHLRPTTKSPISATAVALDNPTTAEFDFSKALSPPPQPGNDSAVAMDDSTVEDIVSPPPEPEARDMVFDRNSAREETNTSDADIDSNSSDSDPYEERFPFGVGRTDNGRVAPEAINEYLASQP
ncbi:acyl transferase/acyl hydrolase/lysophospholipase [Immersiella caudata]|uniref:Patatin-like phospholipase domain-containing protein n=1 Tax=Immersiella caudata TaxID=314043 RepID=A0AA39WAW3_9PEZI|nr:acyl transferase/acyl hydrolase/lysophospholipase [Immersiella caudata]